MKTYFAKYLPVEGEIKEGDYFKYHESDVFQCKDITDIDGDCYKVKLFLCSRDIQVGDQVYYLQDGEYLKSICTQSNDDGIDIDHPVHFYPPEVFKVIGEISPDAATRVKEGHEFEKGEEYYLCGCGHAEEQNDIHSVYDKDDNITDLCEKCWRDADLILKDNKWMWNK
jgi:hypothetical protein